MQPVSAMGKASMFWEDLPLAMLNLTGGRSGPLRYHLKICLMVRWIQGYDELLSNSSHYALCILVDLCSTLCGKCQE